MSSSCLQLLQMPAAAAKRVWWRGLSARLLGLRRRPCPRAGAAGLGGLRKEVRECEYDDIHAMWDMLGSNPSGTSSAAAATRRARSARKSPVVVAWSRLTFYCCGF